MSAFAQKSNFVHVSKQCKMQTAMGATSTAGIKNITTQRATASGDTVYMTHIAPSDTISLYQLSRDSGFVAGMDSYNDKGFAERYDFSGNDSALRVVGLIARFGGTVNPASVRSVIFHVWSPAQKSVASRPTLYNSGFPGTLVATMSVPFPELGIATVDTAEDSAKLHMFAYPSGVLSHSFFVGCNITYTWGNSMNGDTIGIYSNKDGERTAPSYTVYSATDTTINNVNVTQYSDGIWHDNAVDNFAMSINLFVFPVITIAAYYNVTSIQGVKRNGFTFYGNYPNPAASATNIKLALDKPSDVTIEIMDMSSRIISTTTSTGMAAGTHTIPVNTTALPAGDYVYLVRTSAGDGIASKLTIAK